MRLLVVTSAPTIKTKGQYAAYAPYVSEMDIWFKYVDSPIIISPTTYPFELLLSSFKKQPKVISVPALNFTSFFSSLRSVFNIPIIVFSLINAMSKANHIHLRCPGNIGLLGSFVQILFPKKMKTSKYAGNWDPKAKQPLSYRIQKWILRNTFFTKNMQVLVYGNWQVPTKNIKPFFTASFYKSEIEPVLQRNYKSTLQFLFVGSLVKGKQPMLVIKTIEKLHRQGYNVSLDIYGSGVLEKEMETYILENNLKEQIVLHGNKPKEQVKSALQESHFLILPSKSEGWPKAVAEAMFFGVIPVVTAISCVPDMLDNENRGILIEDNLDKIVDKITDELKNIEALKMKSKRAALWSQNYTLDVFESEIAKLLAHI